MAKTAGVRRPVFFPELATLKIGCMDKKNFLRNRLVPLLRQLPSDTPPQWGRMTLQQMVEHFSDAMRMASGKMVVTDIVTPSEHLERMREFMKSDKPFRENTVNPLMPVVPAPVKNPSLDAALDELQQEVDHFFTVFEKNNQGITRNAFFGDLDFEENLQLLTKHAQHHLKQFGVQINNDSQ
jgi:hypothetical protein